MYSYIVIKIYLIMKLISKNKRIWFDYEITDSIEVGIVLRWYEVKALREGKINIRDAVALIHTTELWVHNIDIPLYSKANYKNIPWYEPKSKRKLLIKKRELAKLSSKIDKTWASLLVQEIYFTDKQLVKIKLGLWKKRKKIEKRSVIKEKEMGKQMDKAMKKYN